MEIPSQVPVLPIRNAVVFPGATMPLVVGRPRSVNALKEAQVHNNLIVVVTQRVLSKGDPAVEDLYQFGTLCRIENVVTTDQGGFQVVVSGVARYHAIEYTSGDNFLSVRGETVADAYGSDQLRTQALFNNLKDLARTFVELLPGVGEHMNKLLEKMNDPGQLTNMAAAYLNIPVQEKQTLLEEVQVETRLEKLLSHMIREREVLQIQKDIHEKMSDRLSKAQREAILREQMRTIQTELGEDEDSVSNEFKRKILEAGLPEDVKKIADEELKRLEMVNQSSPEYQVIRNYLDWICAMPWSKSTQDEINLEKAEKILNEDHFGLERVKKRILEFLAVAKLKNDLRGPILCLVGPPGVGKTSLGQSIAKALGKKFIRSSLGGVRDEAEIRGHRRTYIGAMPGRIVQSLKRVGVKNPVFMLDEIDKLSMSFQGDPASALLEVLDPEQNKDFVDHYLDVSFNLSNVFFIATANVVDTIPGPLRDRMEIIDVSGYTIPEKLHIAKQYLVPKQFTEHGLKMENLLLPDETILRVITHYTRESGVRELQRQIASLCRGAAVEVLKKKEAQPAPSTEVGDESVPTLVDQMTIESEQVVKYLGPEKYLPESSQKIAKPGVVTGLAWTPHGGDILFIEASNMPGSGKMTLTGQLGDVMKESAQIALSLVRGAARRVAPTFNFDKEDIHIHVPSGAIPKDGPSAGVTMISALASMVAGKPVSPKTAMTGEITLRGAVLPIGGVREKLVAAHRAGIEKIYLPKQNERDLSEVPEEVKSKLQIKLVETVDELLTDVLGFSLQTLEPWIKPSIPDHEGGLGEGAH